MNSNLNFYPKNPVFGTRPYPLKARRLEQLDELGINIADFICFVPNQFDAEQLRDFCARHKMVSCRTFAENEDKEFKTPVRYEIEDPDEVERFVRAQNKKYFVLVNEALPLTYRVAFRAVLHPHGPVVFIGSIVQVPKKGVVWYWDVLPILNTIFVCALETYPRLHGCDCIPVASRARASFSLPPFLPCSLPPWPSLSSIS